MGKHRREFQEGLNGGRAKDCKHRSLFWIVMVAFAVRILVIFLFHTYRFGAGQPYTYGYEMGRIGRSIAQGYGFGNIYDGRTGPTSWEPPVYPYLVGGVFRLFGIYSQLSAFVLLAINSIFSALTCVFIYLTAKRCFGEPAAIASASLWMLYPLAIYWSATWIWETALSTFLFTVLFWLTLTMDERQGTKPWTVFGLLWGLAALSNPSLISFLPASGLWALRQYVRNARPWLAGVVVASLVFFACLAPWQIRNYRTFGQFFFVRGDFGMILRMGNGPEARGAWLIGLMPSRNPAEYERYVTMGEPAYAAAQGQQAMQFIRENPGRFLVLCLKRVFFYWSGNPRSSLFQASIVVNLFEIITSAICFWGLARAFRQGIPGAWLFFWLMLLFPVIYYLTYPNIRYREPIEPFMIILTVFLITGRKPGKSIRMLQNWLNAQRSAVEQVGTNESSTKLLQNLRYTQNPPGGVLSAMAFHEKAGRNQVGSFVFSSDEVFSPAESPLSPSPSALSRSDWFARCKLGVLVTAGAAT